MFFRSLIEKMLLVMGSSFPVESSNTENMNFLCVISLTAIGKNKLGNLLIKLEFKQRIL
jgi:hypothetical protein